ncbi:MAG: GTPase [Planctomycetes bacterium]|nr:GTPase [Planctomycetota bacterium]
MTLNAWDFGGQEIYHSTHQFFLTNRSLFVLAWNARLGWKQGRLDYWLETIHALAPDSPVLIVATHIDERSAELPFDDLKRKYPHIVNRVEVSSKQPRSGMDELRSAVALAAADLPLMGAEWPADWVAAAETVRARKENQIATQELMTLFTDHGVADDSRKVLARALHELGDILHFEDDKELGDTVLLNPQWVTENISRVLEHDEIVEGLGIFRRSHMKVVWKDVDEGTRERFLRLMEKFDLSYRIPDDVKNRSLIVERLSQDPAEYQSRWDAIVQREACKEISMKFDLGLPRPAGIPTWFIARSHRFTTHTHWLYGALFADDRDQREYKHLALLLAPPADEEIVTLTVRGPSPHSFFALLRDGLELTLGRFAGLRDQIKRTMPCPGHHGEACTHSFDFAQVQKAIERESPVLEMQCPVAFKNVSVPHLLFGIHGSTQDAVLERIDELDRANAERHSESMAELAGLRELTQREFTKQFNRDQRLAESHCPRVFSLRPAGGKSWPVIGKLLGSKWNLQLYCEYPGCWHPTNEGGLYEIKKPGKWINDLAPHVQGLIKVLQFVAPIAGPWLAYSLPQLAKLLKKDVDLMKGLVDGLGELDVHADRDLTREYGMGETGSRKHVEGASLRGLRKLLDELDPKQHWGGLRKLLTPEGHYLWLCEYHYKAYEQ